MLRGLRVIVIDRDARANGASVRNFGFVTVTGQERGASWERARKSCAIWQQIASEADIPILQHGLWLLARRQEAAALFEAFLQTEMGEGCEILRPAAARARCAHLGADDLQAVLTSSVDCRVESREAIPKVARWLENRGVTFLRSTAVLEVEPPRVLTSRGTLGAGAAVVCPGDDFASLFPERMALYDVTRCKLQMLKLADPGFRLPATVMSDLGLIRYPGYGALPQADALRARLHAEQPEYFAHGIHLIVAQGADGSLIVGDSHHYADTPPPFATTAIDDLILDEYAAALGAKAPRVLERWTGTYASAPGRTLFIDTPAPGVRLVVITGGTGASTGFAVGEEVVADLFQG